MNLTSMFVLLVVVVILKMGLAFTALRFNTPQSVGLPLLIRFVRFNTAKIYIIFKTAKYFINYFWEIFNFEQDLTFL